MPTHGMPDPATEQAIREQLAAGVGMLKIGRNLKVGTTVVQRIAKELAA